MANQLVLRNVNGREGVLNFSDIGPLVQVLSSIDRGHVNALRSSARQLIAPVRDSIRNNIKSTPPLSQMTPKVIPGRLTWGTGQPANATKIETPYLKKKAKYNSIARVKTLSAATGLADMGGRGRRYIAKYPYTREYPYSLSPTGMRKHRITRAGSEKFIENLNARLGQAPSRMVWPAAEKSLPAAREKFRGVLQTYYDQVNVRLRS